MGGRPLNRRARARLVAPGLQPAGLNPAPRPDGREGGVARLLIVLQEHGGETGKVSPRRQKKFLQNYAVRGDFKERAPGRGVRGLGTVASN